MAVPYDRIPTVIRSFRRTPAMLVRYFGRHLRLLLSPRRMGLERRWLVLFSTLMLPIWFVTGMPGRRTPQSAS